MKYRPEIDGLRALSVFSVIIYHAKITISGNIFLQGGFLGVDIFFVISGYLITSIILTEIETTNNFVFSHFYERRVRRILPALLTVTLFSIFIAYFVLLPNQLIDFFQSVISSLFFYSNYFFYFIGEQYNAPPSLLVPLLHYWSLGVEEQYYIIYPLFIYFLFKKNFKLIFFSLCIIFCLSFFSSIINVNPVFNFFSLHTRIWELLAGGIIAYLMFKKVYIGSKKISSFLIYLGLILIILSLFLINDSHNHLALKTLPAIIGVSLIIFCSNKENFLIKILSLKFITFFGLISYSLYLWHYPIFSYARITGLIQNDLINKIIIGLSIIILSILSYYFIERPFRNKNKIKKKNLFLIIGLIYILIMSCSFFVISKNGLPERFPKIFFKKYSFENYIDDIEFNKGSKGEIILIGDSHADTLSNELNNAAQENDFSLKRFHTHMLLPEIQEYDLIMNSIDDNFYKKNTQIINYLKQSKGSTIVIYNYYSLRILEKDANNKKFRKIFVGDLFSNDKNTSFKQRYDLVKKTFIDTISEISKNNKVIIIYPTPEFKVSVPIALIKKIIFTDKTKIPIITSDYETFIKKRKLIFEILDELPSNVKKINAEKFFCNNVIEKKCVGNTEENLLFSDNHHLSNYASKYVVDEIINLINK